MKTHRTVVMGGAGFLGSHLCDRLLAEGHEVTAVDDFSTGSRVNVAHLAEHARFKLLEHDVSQPFDARCDWVFNLASPASPVHYQADPIQTTLTNVLGTYHALSLGERYGARVMQASTSEIYGDPEVHPQPESYWGNVNTVGPRSCYDEGKRCAETLVMDFHRERDVEVRLVRIFNTYGPRMALDTVLGFEPKTPLRLGLERTLAAFRDVLEKDLKKEAKEPRTSPKVRAIPAPQRSQPRIAVGDPRGQ